MIFRLVLLSILVGVILKVLGSIRWTSCAACERYFTALWDMGFDAVRWLWRYFLLGAAIVVPIWLWCGWCARPQGR